MFQNNTLNKTLFEISNKREFFEMVLYSAVSFLLPILLGHPQIVVGITVNALLIMSALNLKNHKLLPVMIMPSLGALSRGLIFGPFTIYLVYMIPFIWVGNFILVYMFKSMYVAKKKNYLLTVLSSSAAKTIFLFGSAFLLFSLNIIPAPFLAAMGIMQFVTAVSAGFICYGAVKVMKK